MKLSDIIILIVVGIGLIWFVFNKKIYSISCNTENCTVFVKKGYLSMQSKPKYTIQHDEIRSIEIYEYNHRTHNRHGNIREHTDYYPVVIFNNGRKLKLPFQKCHSRYDVEAIKNGILGKQTFKYPSK